MNFKLIKSSPFTFEREGKEVKGVAHTISHKGRAINVSSLNFEEGELTTKEGILSIKGDVELVVDNYLDPIEGVKKGLKLLPKMDLSLGI